MYLVEVVVIRWRRYSSRVEEEATRNYVKMKKIIKVNLHF